MEVSLPSTLRPLVANQGNNVLLEMAGALTRQTGWRIKMLTRVVILILIFGFILAERIEAQAGQSTSGQRTSTETPREPEPDSLERDTPRSAIVAFLRAIQRENYERAAQYLDSRLKLRERQELARQLGVVLDRKLSISLNALSDEPEGDIDDGQRTNRDQVGVIQGKSGDVEILLDRVQRGRDRPVWLFSSESLQDVPGLYREIEPVWLEQFVPDRFRTRRWFHIPLYQWMAGLLALPLILVVAAILSRALIVLLRPIARRFTQEADDRKLARNAWPLRLQVLACVIYAASRYSVSLLTRRFWTSVAI
jgi:MscS family membrane protein